MLTVLKSSPCRRHEGGAIASDWISILVAGQDGRAYVSQLEITDKAPGIIVIMEVLGVKHPIREVTDRLSREDDVAMAPALYHCA